MLALCICTSMSPLLANSYLRQDDATLGQDTTRSDTLQNEPRNPYRPTFSPDYRFGDPFSNSTDTSPLLLKDPSSLELDVEIDSSLNYTIYEKIGDLNYRPTSSMTFDQFNDYQNRQLLKSYWKNRSAGLDGESAVSSRNIIPPIYVSPLLDRIFGGSYVEIIPRGLVTLDFGANFQNTSASGAVRQQRTGGFEFNQQISMNVTGKVGEKLAVTANFDNNNSFDFENNLKVEYTGYEEDIIKKLEIGNVSLPLNNTLMTGASNLFGIKAQMQFGKLYVTSVMSTMRGKTESIEVGGGGIDGQGRQFEFIASDYDENRHFFLGHFFRDNYEEWLKGTPQVFTGVNITRVEVYVLNRVSNTQTLRNVAAFMDLGEPSRIYNNAPGRISPNPAYSTNDNSANDLWLNLKNIGRNESQIIENIQSLGLGMVNGIDFEKVAGARKLESTEYKVNNQMGYISLKRKLQNDEVLAVAFEYTYNGQSFKVGELSEDYANRSEDEVIYMKMLRPRNINIRNEESNKIIPTWDLMMKNIYYLNSNQIEQTGFDLQVIYRDDLTGIDNPSLQEGVLTQNKPIIEILGLDRLNPSNDRQSDGNFDFVEGVTIDVENGLILFPYLEPFNTPIAEKFTSDPNREALTRKYVYDTLYRTTKADAQLVAEKNKYYIIGQMQSGSASEIHLRGFSVAEGSVKVFAGGSLLVEGADYQVDYAFGRVRITNQGVLSSGKQITVNYETADVFNFQSRTLLGSRFDYRLSDEVNLGATVLYLNERPLVSRISAGNEPIRNLKYGLDVNMSKESRTLTKAIDLLPLIQTKAPSKVNFSAEFAQLRPGTSNKVNGESTSYIDDFESSVTPYNLNNPSSWKLASTPQKFTKSNVPNPNTVLESGYRRAKLAWYRVDNIFYRTGGANNPELPEELIANHYVRAVSQQEIFPFKTLQAGNNNELIFDLAYFPSERGPYNYNPNLQSNGFFSPNASEDNWGGITQAIRNEVDFDKSNIQYIEFWMMDPFINETNGDLTHPNGLIDDGISTPKANTTGGTLVFNLGSISEDVIPDHSHAFENGLPSEGNSGVTSTEWGQVTTKQFLTNSFDNDENRDNQDVGLDGLRNDTEPVHFNTSFIQRISSGLDNSALQRILGDVSADNFQHYLNFTQQDNIIARYKNFNGHDGNTPIVKGNSSFSPIGSNLPDNEDINADNTLSESEDYYEYEVSIRSGDMEVGKNHIVDQIIAEDPNSDGQNIKWYLFRVPIRAPDRKVGSISGFKSIKYIRTYLTEFKEPVVLRMANFRLVGSQWRKYNKSLLGDGIGESSDNDDPNNLTISVVNIEENSQGNATKSPYVLPPDINRDPDNTSNIQRQLNEQSLQLCVEDLEDNDARAAYKDTGFDLLNYGRLKMFIHANSVDANNGELAAFIRIGKDDNHYYEIEIPLTISLPSASLAADIWPLENELNIAFDDLYQLKKDRVESNASDAIPYPISRGKQIGNQYIKVKGNPVINDVSRILIGVRNIKSPDQRPLSGCVWVNELRVTDFDNTAGWATNATLNAQLADFGSVTASTQYTSVGFGGIQSRISDRTRDETLKYDVSANLNLDKFVPEEVGMKIPMYVSYEKETIKPKFDPADADLTVKESLVLIQDDEERNNYELQVQDNTVRRSINFINVQKVKTDPEAKSRVYDIENLAFTYTYSDRTQSNFSIAQLSQRTYTGAVDYIYAPKYEGWSPFAESESFNSPYFKMIKDFNINPIPENISVRAGMNRQFTKTVYRNREGEQPNYEKYFYFDRSYSVRWGITNGLSLDYSAQAHSVIDEPEGDINTEIKKDSIWANIRNLGRLKNFDQNISANYRLPLDKLPFTDWMSADYRYAAGYSWTAGPKLDSLESEDLNFGHIIQNNRNQALTGKFDLVKLYNKVKVLNDINGPVVRRSTGRTTNAIDTTKSVLSQNKFSKGLLRGFMSVRSINATYNIDDGMLLPGYNVTPFLFGMDSAFSAPGLPFIFGSQDDDIRYEAANNGWLVKNDKLTTQFSQSRTINLALKANIEPFSDLKIQLDANKRKNSVYQENFRFEEDSLSYVSFSPVKSGSYSVSFFTLKTAFSKDGPDDTSEIFQEFETNRQVILDRISSANAAVIYDLNSQDVLIPAFIAAYTGKAAGEVGLSPFPKTPIPNWRIDYSGLSKIQSLQTIFSSISISHSYQSSYSVNGYSTPGVYGVGGNLDLNQNVEDYNSTYFASKTTEEGVVIPRYSIGQVIISEQFAPLVGINLRTQERATIKVEYRTKRDLSLNLSNNQVAELRANDFVFEYGFTKANFQLPFKSRGRPIVLKNDLQFRTSFTVRNTNTFQRKIEGENEVTDGNVNYQLRPSINYALNQKLNLQIYFERSIYEPKITRTGGRRATTAFGFKLSFSLAQ